MPRYSASVIVGAQLQAPAVNTASTSPAGSPASASAARAARACWDRTVRCGVLPTSDSATPTIAARRPLTCRPRSLPDPGSLPDPAEPGVTLEQVAGDRPALDLV